MRGADGDADVGGEEDSESGSQLDGKTAEIVDKKQMCKCLVFFKSKY